MKILEGRHLLITGGTGSLGKAILHRVLTGSVGTPETITIFSRDEAKQDALRHELRRDQKAMRSRVRFHIGDIRDYAAVANVVKDADLIIHAAALKQVPSCEYVPREAMLTNVVGPQNLIRAINETDRPVHKVVAISTDKACEPINVMGMTKALMERHFVAANLASLMTTYACVRYGNVIASRGSVVPLFIEQIARGGPLTVTTRNMTRFFLSLDQAVDTVLAALNGANRGEIYIPRVQSARIADLVDVLLKGNDKIPVVEMGIRPGEKMHEQMVSLHELQRTVTRGDYYVIRSDLNELRSRAAEPLAFQQPYSSSNVTLGREGIAKLLGDAGIEY